MEWVVSPCFRENVVATCKIGSFLYSLDNLLQKNVLVLFLEIKFQNGAHLKTKGLGLTYFSHFLVTREKLQKFLHTYLTYIRTLTLLTFFCHTNYDKKKCEFIRYGFSLVGLVLIVILAILEQSINNKMVSKIQVGMSTTDMYLHLCQIHSHL